MTLIGAAGPGRAGTISRTGSGTSASAMVFATAVAIGWIHSCALTRAGEARCWGYAHHGELGNGEVPEFPVLSPVRVAALGDATAIATGARHGCAITTAGGVRCWGYNSYGQLGDGTNVDRPTSVQVTGLTSGVTAVAATGAFHTCALTAVGGQVLGAERLWPTGRRHDQ